jgi:hypothetical protein
MATTTAPTTPDGAASRGRRVPLLADAPVGDPELDRFGFREFAHALTLIIDDEGTATPLTIAISAPWGGGKTSLGCMVQTLLEQRVRNRGNDDPRPVVWFNAWEHDDAPHLGAALAAVVARTTDRNRSMWRRAIAPLPTAMLRPGDRSRQTVVLALFSAAVALLVTIVGPSRDAAEALLGQPDAPAAGAGALGVVFLALFVSRRLFTTAREAARFIDDPRSAAARGAMSDVKAQFGRLIRHATHEGRLLIIIDDLERCTSDRALEVCQVASQLLAQRGVVTIVLADMEPIARSAGARYASRMSGPEQVDPEEIGRRYLAKIVQLEIALPPPAPDDMRRVIRGYGSSLREGVPQTQRLSSWGRIREAFAPDALLCTIRAGRRRVASLGRELKASELRFAGLWRTIERVVERARWWPVGLMFAGVVVYGAIDPAWLESDEDNSALGFVFIAGAAIGYWSRRLRKRKREQLRSDLVDQIEELKGQKLSPEEIKREVQRTSALPEADPGLINDLVSSSFLDSAEFRDVETFIADPPPALPHGAGAPGRRTSRLLPRGGAAVRRFLAPPGRCELHRVGVRQAAKREHGRRPRTDAVHPLDLEGLRHGRGHRRSARRDHGSSQLPARFRRAG